MEAAGQQREQRLERLAPEPDHVAVAFAAGGGVLTRDGVKQLLQRLGRFEGWVDSALAGICDGGLRMAAGDAGATVDTAAFAEWWSAEGSLSGPEQLDRRWDDFSARFDRLSAGVLDILRKIPAAPTASPLGREQLAQAVSSTATAELLGRPLFPMFVVAISAFLELTHPLPPHEEMLAAGLLWEVVEDETELGNFVLYPGSPTGTERGPVHTMGQHLAMRAAADRSEAGPERHEPEPEPEPKPPEAEPEEDPAEAEYMRLPAKFSRNRFIAVSHQWLRPSRDAMAHPDSADGTSTVNFLKQWPPISAKILLLVRTCQQSGHII